MKNGGDHTVGAGKIDLDYLLGTNGGHMNVNGSAGRGTKSSFLLFINWMLLREARRQHAAAPTDKNRLRIVPIIFNVKNYDLMFIDHKNQRFDQAKHLQDWRDLGISDPQPFQNVSYYVAQEHNSDNPYNVGRTDGIKKYSWSLSDVIEQGIFRFLFAEVDSQNENFIGLVSHVESHLTVEKIEGDGQSARSLTNKAGMPKSFRELLGWVENHTRPSEDEVDRYNHHLETWRKFHRRLRKVVYESRGVLCYEDQKGTPLKVDRKDTYDPIVVDLNALTGIPELQRFVVATILRQLVEARTGKNAQQGLVYVLTLDELNRFAPRGATDSITRLIETVAAEMRSQGIILLGAQQHASRVSERVIESAAIQVLGRTGVIELNSPVWRGLSKSAKSKAEQLALKEKLVIQDNFREPMHVRVPFPVWAMNPREAGINLEQDGSPQQGQISKHIDD
jgi:DNA helicase HerA-like ATPase